VRRHHRIWSKELTTTKTILSRLRKLENGHLSPVESEAGRRAREANERLHRRMAAANARLKALGDEYSQPEIPALTESERAALSCLTLGQRIRYHAQDSENGLRKSTGKTRPPAPYNHEIETHSSPLAIGTKVFDSVRVYRTGNAIQGFGKFERRGFGSHLQSRPARRACCRAYARRKISSRATQDFLCDLR
jgi:hypothetical protein